MEPMALDTIHGSPVLVQYLPCYFLNDFSQRSIRNRLSPIQNQSLAFANLRSLSSLSSSINKSNKQKNDTSIKSGPPIIDLYDDVPLICKMPTSMFTLENLSRRRQRISNQKESSNNSCYDYNSHVNGSMSYPFNPNLTFNNQSTIFQSTQFGYSQISGSEVFNNTNNVKSPVVSGAKRSYPYPETSFQSAYDASLMSHNYSNTDEQEYWVTVFGFITEMSGDILNHFQNVGNVIDKYTEPDSNYICLKYASRPEVRQVLAYNGFLFKPGTIIGVKLCDRPEQIGRDVVCSPINNANESKTKKRDQCTHLPQPSITISPSVIQAKKKKRQNCAKRKWIVGKVIDYIMGR